MCMFKEMRLFQTGPATGYHAVRVMQNHEEMPNELNAYHNHVLSTSSRVGFSTRRNATEQNSEIL